MAGIGTMIVGAIMVILAICGLFLAAQTHEPSFYTIGLALFVFGAGFVFLLIKQAYDYHERR